MSPLTNYNPLKTIWLPGAELVDPSGVIVVVGPNSSGKSLLLRDIDNYLSTGNTHFVVCEAVAGQRPADFQGFFDELVKNNYLQHFSGHGEQYRCYVPPYKKESQHTQYQRQPFQLDFLKKAFNEFSSARNANNCGWFNSLGLVLSILLSLDNRRILCHRCNSIDYKNAAPDHPIHGLYLDSSAQDRLASETSNVFGNAAWLDISEKDCYQLRVSGSTALPTHGEMNNPRSASRFAPIEQEGDGYCSYVGICLSLMIAQRPVSMIDEPELCLHPPQAYHIGRFIGQYAPDSHVTLIATHSSHVLRGVLETGKRVTVIRLTKNGRRFKANLIDNNELVDNLRNPRTRAESILDGVFSKSVVLVESEGDREEYQAAAEAIDDYPSREVHFAPVGGTGGFTEPLRFYKSLDIPIAVIADLDAICDSEKIVAITEMQSGATEAVVESLRAVSQQIKSLPSSISEVAVKARLKELSQIEFDWRCGGDNILRRHLNELVGQLKRVNRLKDGGLTAYSDNPKLQADLKEIVNQLALIGIFLVPVGELEDWALELMVDYPKSASSKSERAAIAANRIREATVKRGDIWEFIRKVLDFVSQ